MLNLTIFCYQVTMIIITNMVSFKTPSKEDVIISVLQIRKLRFRVIKTCTKTQSPHSLEVIGRFGTRSLLLQNHDAQGFHLQISFTSIQVALGGKIIMTLGAAVCSLQHIFTFRVLYE